MSVQVKHRRDTAANIATFTPAQGELIVDTTSNRVIVGDGVTAGGWPASKASEAVLNTAASNVLAQGANGSNINVNIVEQLVTSLSGGSVSASTQIPAGALVLAVSSRVVTSIAGAASFGIGYAGNLGAFGSGLTTSVGATNGGLIGPNPFYSATTIILTAAGGAFTAGAVRLAVIYLEFTPPTS